MIWIVIYLLIGVAAVALLVVLDLPYDVEVVDVIAVPFLVLFWPGVVLFLVFEGSLLDRHLFTIGGSHHDNQD